jgi:hypothetical protein
LLLYYIWFITAQKHNYVLISFAFSHTTFKLATNLHSLTFFKIPSVRKNHCNQGNNSFELKQKKYFQVLLPFSNVSRFYLAPFIQLCSSEISNEWICKNFFLLLSAHSLSPNFSAFQSLDKIDLRRYDFNVTRHISI